MKKVYLITTKSFYKDVQGIDQQFADYGIMPSLFTSLKKAKNWFEHLKIMRIEEFHEELKQENPKGRVDSPRMIAEFVTISPISNVRHVISLWYDWIE